MNKLFVSTVLILVIFTSCIEKTITGNGNVVTVNRDLKGFKGVSISGAFKVELRNSDREVFKIIADENLVANIESRISDSILYISNKFSVIRSKELKLIIGNPKLSTLDFSGAVELTSDTIIRLKQLAITISGAGKINLGIESNKLFTAVSGGADLTIHGKTNNFEISVSGAGNVNAIDLQTIESKVDITGIGNVKLNASDKLDISASGIGNIAYKGNPRVTQSISGAGKVEKIE